MNLFTLPVEIQDYIYDIDGRYKIAKGKCIDLIRQRGETIAMLERSQTWHRTDPRYSFTLECNNYHICLKTGIGIIYYGNEAVGCITKEIEFHFWTAVKHGYNPETDVEVEVDGKDYYLRNGLYIVSIKNGLILGKVYGDEVEWISSNPNAR